MSKCVRVYLLLGSNVEKEHYIPKAIALLKEAFSVSAVSSVYESPAVGCRTPQPDYWNVVVGLDTELSVWALRDRLRELESQLDRQRNFDKFSARTIDMDILLYGDAVVDERGVCIPDPDILKYDHVLVPLKELAGEVLHPVEKKCIQYL